MSRTARATAAQHGFPFKAIAAQSKLLPGEKVVDLFAGGGGASEGLEQAIGRAVDVAINHDQDAVQMHAMNHPLTQHYCEDVWAVDPRKVLGDATVGWLHASPDCTHHSQARGGQPRKREIRSLSWVVLKWAGIARPRIISLENVEQILQWSPLVAKRCKKTGRVMRLDGTVAAPGERTPIEQQFLVPDTRRKGHNWERFVGALRAMGYAVQWRKLKASDFGAGTSRERLFLVARRDGQPIAWPKPTHGRGPGLLPLVTAADCIDWSIPCPSIFLSPAEAKKYRVRRPLKPNTERRIARGIRKFVLEAPEPFIVNNMTNNVPRPVTDPVGTIMAGGGHKLLTTPLVVRTGQTGGSGDYTRGAVEPLSTVVSKAEHCVVSPLVVGVGGRAGQTEPRPAGEPHYTTTGKADAAVVAPVLVQAAHGEGRPGGVQRWGDGARSPESALGTITASGGHAVAAACLAKFRGQSPGSAADEPMHTITAGGDCARPAGAAHALGVVTAFMEQANTGMTGHDARDPVSTIVGKGSTQRLVSAHMATLRQHSTGTGADEALSTIAAGGEHHAVVEYTLSPEHEAGALRVAAFLIRYYGSGGQHGDLTKPLATMTTKDRLALVTVWIHGHPYVVVDIGLRMLTRRELFLAQGFRPDYVIDRGADGRVLTNTTSVRMVGNSVSPHPLRAIAEANLSFAPGV